MSFAYRIGQIQSQGNITTITEGKNVLNLNYYKNIQKKKNYKAKHKYTVIIE